LSPSVGEIEATTQHEQDAAIIARARRGPRRNAAVAAAPAAAADRQWRRGGGGRGLVGGVGVGRERLAGAGDRRGRVLRGLGLGLDGRKELDGIIAGWAGPVCGVSAWRSAFAKGGFAAFVLGVGGREGGRVGVSTLGTVGS